MNLESLNSPSTEAAAVGPLISQATLSVDPSQILGPMKPVNGVNNGPFCLDGILDFSAEFRAAAFADVRTHDANYPCRNVCDINAVFPREDADPTDPASYDFALTDHYLKTIRDTGATITYRLGYTIDHHPIKRYSHPPRDFQHWAQVCLGIARHYNEGWANGFKNWVARWEIWNEPDNAPGPNSPCWTGAFEDYITLYEITSKVLKSHNPEWQVGGPGATGGGGCFAAPAIAVFLEHCAKTGSPLDFYSWHSYESRTQEIQRLSREVQAGLGKFGFAATENILNEWRYGPNNEWDVIFRCNDPKRRKEKAREMNSPAAASFAAAVLLDMQDGPVSLANYYTADTIPYFGMFDIHGTPLDPYQAFLCFAALAKGSQQVAVCRDTATETLHAVATLGENGRIRLMAVNDSPRPLKLTLSLPRQTAPWKIEHAGFWAELAGNQLTLPAHAFACVGAGF